ncbi:hypothetical protein BV20DRAFT_46073 [Pilatotrama ljubarskyi]|nr:hypothetical protein BV20DRAFT_46073 [Pilatotrama ljubarskyi]
MHVFKISRRSALIPHTLSLPSLLTRVCVRSDYVVRSPPARVTTLAYLLLRFVPGPARRSRVRAPRSPAFFARSRMAAATIYHTALAFAGMYATCTTVCAIDVQCIDIPHIPSKCAARDALDARDRRDSKRKRHIHSRPLQSVPNEVLRRARAYVSGPSRPLPRRLRSSSTGVLPDQAPRPRSLLPSPQARFGLRSVIATHPHSNSKAQSSQGSHDPPQVPVTTLKGRRIMRSCQSLICCTQRPPRARDGTPRHTPAVFCWKAEDMNGTGARPARRSQGH